VGEARLLSGAMGERKKEDIVDRKVMATLRNVAV
jgi:hypothetical protein